MNDYESAAEYLTTAARNYRKTILYSTNQIVRLKHLKAEKDDFGNWWERNLPLAYGDKNLPDFGINSWFDSLSEKIVKVRGYYRDAALGYISNANKSRSLLKRLARKLDVHVPGIYNRVVAILRNTEYEKREIEKSSRKC